MLELFTKQIMQSPGFKATLDKVTAFISTVEQRLETIEDDQKAIIATLAYMDDKNGRG